MTKKEKAGFLFRVYRKKSSSLLLNLYKAGITGLEDDIHKARTDVKKIRAFYSFLEVLNPDNFNKESYNQVLKSLFNQAGKLREVQVNLMILEQYGTHTDEEHSFRLFLQEEEKILAGKFLDAIRDYDEKQIISKEKEIRKFMAELEPGSFSRNVDKFVRKKSAKILTILPEIRDTEALHKIRKHLKTISSILDVSIRCSHEPNDAPKELHSEIVSVETLIGACHDNIIFLNAIKSYRKAISTSPADSDTVLLPIESKVNMENDELVTRLEKMINALIVDSILSKPRWNWPIIEFQNGRE